MKLLFVCLILALIVGSVCAIPVTGTVTHSNTLATFTRDAGNVPPCWFKWGVGTNLYWTTPNQTTCGSDFQYGAPMLTGQAYNVSACDATGCDATPENWVVEDAKMMEITDFGSGVTTMMRSGFNVTQVSAIIIQPYTDNLAYIVSGTVSEGTAAQVRDNAGGIIIGILFFFIFVGYWLRGQGIGLPSFMGILSYAVVFSAGQLGANVPPDFMRVAYLLLVVGVAGLLYSWGSNK